MKYLTINDLDPSLFVSNQVKNTYSRELLDNNQGGADLGSSGSISRSIALRLRQSMSINGLDSLGSDEELLPDENVDAKLEAEENIGICAIIEVCGYTQMIESFAEKVPAIAISKSLEAIIGKIYDIIHEFHGDIVKVDNDFITIFWRLKDEQEDESKGESQNIARQDTLGPKIYRQDSFSGNLSANPHFKLLNQRRKSFNLGIIDWPKVSSIINEQKVSASGLACLPYSTDSINSGMPSPNVNQRKANKTFNHAKAMMNAIICIEKCILFAGQVQTWALEDYVGEKQTIKCDLRCSITYGSIIDVHFGITRIKCSTLCAGAAFSMAQNMLVSDVNLGSIIIAENIYNIMLENGFEFSDGTWIDQGFIISPAPRKSTDYIFGLISDIEKEILYSDVKSKTYTTLIETYLCDQSSRLFKKKQEKTLTQNDLQSTWEKASTMAVRIRNVAMLNNADDLYYSSVETCKRVQEILIRILKITWSNEMFTFHVNTDIDHSVVITFVTYDGEEEGSAVLRMIKIAITLQQMLSKGNFKDVSIGISQGICYKGLLGTEHSIEFRTIGQCINKACALSGTPSCKKKILIEDALVSEYLQVTGCDFFISNEVEVQANTYIVQPKNYKPSFMECHELFSMSAGITSSTLNLQQSIDRVFRSAHGLSSGSPGWREIMQPFLDNNDPKVVLIEGTPGAGKTKMLNLFKDYGEKMKFMVLQAACSENDCYSTPMHLMTVLIPRILDLIDYNVKKLRDSKPSKMEKQNKTNAKTLLGNQSSFASFKGLLFTSNKVKKSGLQLSTDESQYESSAHESSDLIQGLNDASKDPQIVAKIVESMKKVLDKVGEKADEALQLLNYVVLPDLATESIYLMKNGTKTYLLSKLLVRILNRVTEHRSLTLLLDDIQWMVMFIMSARDASDYRRAMIENLKKMPYTLSIDVNKENIGIIEKYLISNHFQFASKVDKHILNFIYRQYGDTIMHADAFAKALLDMNLFSLKNHTLHFSPSFDKTTFPNTFKDLIKWQFNRLLSKQFQKLVKCASIIGRHFSIEELCALWSNNLTSNRHNGNLKSYIHSTLLLYDYFDFFDRITDKDEENFDGALSSYSIYFFRYSEVRHIIRTEIMVENERLLKQKNLISYYEKQLNTITETVHIPLISYHYSVTHFTDLNTIQKRIKYLLMFGSYLCSCTESFMESQFIFMQIDRILEKYGLHDNLGLCLSSDWDINMAISVFNGPEEFSNPSKSVDYLIDGLAKLGFDWPKNRTELKKVIFKGSAIVSFLSWKWIFMEKLKSNKVFPLHSNDSLMLYTDVESHDNICIWKKVSTFLALMSSYLPLSDATIGERIACEMHFLSLNLLYDPQNSLVILISFVKLSLYLLYMGHTNISVFIFKHISKRWNNGEKMIHQSPELFSLSITYLTAAGNWEIVDQQATECMIFCKQRGCFAEWMISCHQKALLFTFNGQFDQAIALTNIAISECESWGVWRQSRILKAVQMCVSIMKGFVLFFPKEEEINALKEDIDESSSLNFLVSSLKTHMLIHSKCWEDAIVELSSTIDFMNGVTPENPEVIYGIMLTALAIYSLLERDDTDGYFGLRNSSDTSFQRLSFKLRRRKSSSTTISPKNTKSSRRSDSGKSVLTIFAGKMLKIISDMPCNFLLQKISILLRTLAKHSDSLIRKYDWNMMKEEAKKLSQDDTKCKYLAIVFLIKSSKLYAKYDDDQSRVLAETLCEKSRIETCLNIL